MQKGARGFTLIELLVIISIIGILLAIAVPSFRNVIANNRINSAAGEILSVLQFAKLEAVRRGKTINIVAESGGSSTNELGNGFTVYFDSNGDGSLSTGETLRLISPLRSTMTVDSTNNYSTFAFSPRGELDHSDEWRICDDRTGELGRKITLLVSGQLQITNYTCS